nr:MAG TPA: hypothetical protein [Caudoviricetes sp.]
MLLIFCTFFGKSLHLFLVMSRKATTLNARV